VVVQVMVPAEVAGVLFTANPVSGKRKEAVIDASIGLGEAVVSGAVSPDNYLVDKVSLEITAKSIGSKQVQVVSLAQGGTAKVEVESAAAAGQALPDEMIRELTRTGSAIEAHYGWPQDIEWAVAGGKLYILQSRPITSLHPLPPAPKDGRFHAYISISSMQGMLEPFTPLGASLFVEMSCYAFVGGDKERAFLHDVAGRLYVDATPLLRGPLGPHFPRLVLPEVEPVIGRIVSRLLAEGRFQQPPPLRPRHVARFVGRYWRTLLPVVARVWRNLLSPAGARRRLRTDILPRLAAMREELLRPHPLGEQPGVMRRVFDDTLKRQIFFRLVTLVIAGIASYKQAENLARREGLDERAIERVRRGLPHNVTTIMDLQLWAMAQRIKADAASRTALEGRDPTALTALYHAGELPPVLQTGMAEFLKRFGHRAVREIDLGVPRWMEDPTYLFGILRNYMGMNDPDTAPDVHFARQKAEAEQAVDDLVAEMRLRPDGQRKAAVLAFLLGRYRQLGGLREAPKFYIMWLFRGIREMMLDAGRQLAAQGRLDRPDDVFFLRFPELEQAGKETTAYQDLVAARRREYARELARTRIPRVLTSEGEVLHGEALAPGDGALGGTGASPGVARGKARVVRDPIGAHLEPGEILVAPSTDPAWTPLFLTAGGLVMEAGGMMSHGSIVAREYGIPAVVGVAEATHRLKDGEEVEVDGHQGIVRVVE
jgi:pyruvate,water dikinase